MSESFSNPMSVRIAAKSYCHISAVANAANIQKLTVVDGDERWELTGNGECGAQLLMPDRKTTHVDRGRLPHDREISLVFEFEDGITQMSTVKGKEETTRYRGRVSIITTDIMAEDGTDNDDNDTIATITCYALVE